MEHVWKTEIVILSVFDQKVLSAKTYSEKMIYTDSAIDI